ncbi:membrane protease YdiL (CAAX protease family) [Crossiella equi]|uniref:Membrane protease YdiL (CAAX protease family) n=1 Tax=Crossiella equi TaxID=130796 RepID=A0ABS5AMY2_9PSEU|nr:type II CAAX endopeptidase family protein [Crossiella equi]MBP2477055.1 membrane protease YdiL (CAAX protease family) [Crossiella equi]
MNAPQTPEPLGEPTGLRWWAALRALGERPADAMFAAPAKPHRWGFGAFLVSFGVFLAVSVALSALFRPAPGTRIEPLELVAVLSLPSVTGALVAVVITWVRGNGPLVDLRLRWNWRHAGIGVAIGGVALVPTLYATQLWAAWVGNDQANSAVGKVLDGVTLSPLLATIVFLHLWLIGPLCEEIVYRGLLWGAVERLGWGRWAAFVLSTMVFAVAHFEPERTPLLLFIAIPMGLARMYTGGLLASILVHQVNNLLPALGMLLIMTGVIPA